MGMVGSWEICSLFTAYFFTESLGNEFGLLMLVVSSCANSRAGTRLAARIADGASEELHQDRAGASNPRRQGRSGRQGMHLGWGHFPAAATGQRAVAGQRS